MPTHDRKAAVDAESARVAVAQATTGADPSRDGVGLEVEFFPVHRGGASHRLSLESDGPGRTAVTTVLGRSLGADPAAGPVRLSGGGVVTTEPGAQVEIATTCCATVDEALAEADGATGALAGWFDRDRAVLAASGVDLWHDLATVPQQLRSPRYPAMAGYLASRAPAGALMMRHTCALQISLDLGPSPQEQEERWLVANLLAAVSTATFANSPTMDGSVRSRRALAWQELDPTRTGFPAMFLEGRGTLEDQVLDAALAADVMLVRTGVDHRTGTLTDAEPGRADWRFADWMEHGHPRHGWPTVDDLRYHLTTLFHEVRARGPIELRSVDALPRRWRPVPVVLYVGALLDPVARARIAEVLERHRQGLPRLLRRAALVGVSDPSLCALAVEVWSFALAGAQRLPGIGRTHLDAAESFLERYTLRGRCPADELAERLRRDPADALAWVSEPVPAAVRSRP